MSAGIKPTQSDTSESSSLPNSRRVYVNGKLPGVRVPFREIAQNPSRNFDGTLAANPPVRVYDTSGPWGDDPTFIATFAKDCRIAARVDSRSWRRRGV